MTGNKGDGPDTGKDQPAWHQQAGLSDETADVRIYPSRHHKDQWKQEADERGLSLSAYVIRMVNKARAHRDLVNPNSQQNLTQDHRIKTLESRVETLQQQLEREREKVRGRREIDDADLIKGFLSTDPKPLDTIIREIVESGVLEELVGRRVEDQLYFLAQNDDVEYDRNSVGWRLADGGER